MTSQRVDAMGRLVVARYSALPFYFELQQDLALLKGARLINSYRQHRWVAEGEWIETLRDHTPRTWMHYRDYLADDLDGPVVLKGRTNSRKHNWRTHMFAQNKNAARAVYAALTEDPLLYPQGIIVREFESFDVCDAEDVAGIPVINEHRVFVLDGVPLTGAYYWAEHEDVVPARWLQMSTDAVAYVASLGPMLSGCPFVAVDVAHGPRGWRVVELNDGQMSGLSCVKPEALYGALKERLCEKS